jgi:hypothetical protein
MRPHYKHRSTGFESSSEPRIASINVNFGHSKTTRLPGSVIIDARVGACAKEPALHQRAIFLPLEPRQVRWQKSTRCHNNLRQQPQSTPIVVIQKARGCLVPFNASWASWNMCQISNITPGCHFPAFGAPTYLTAEAHNLTQNSPLVAPIKAEKGHSSAP